MLDPILVLKVQLTAASLATALHLLGSWPWRAPHPVRSALGGLIGVGLGFYLGCWQLGVQAHWPPLEDQDRLMLVLIPALLVVEMGSACWQPYSLLIWPLRLIVAAGAARILLHGSSYLTTAPNAVTWTPMQQWLILGSMAAALAAVWFLLVTLLQRSTSAPAEDKVRRLLVLLALALTCAAAAVTLMLSSYFTGGQIGLPLSAAVTGVALASLVVANSARMEGVASFGLVGLFALLVVGHFFGKLTTSHAVLLLLAPLLCWMREITYLRTKPWRGGVATLVLCVLPLAFVVAQAWQHFSEIPDQAAPAKIEAPSPNEPSNSDYEDFQKQGKHEPLP